MTGLISCGYINKRIIFAIIGGLGKMFIELVYKVDNDFKKHPLIIGIASAIGMCLSSIPFIIYKIKYEKGEKKFNSLYNFKRRKLSPYQRKKLTKRQRKKKFTLILVSAFLDFAQKVLTFIFVDKIEYNFLVFDMLCISILSYFILKHILYSHKFISLIIMIIFGIILNIIINLYGVSTGIKPSIVFVFLIELLFSINIVINGFLLAKSISVPYEISFYQGIFDLLFFYILLIIFTNVEINNENFQNIDYKGKKYLDNFFSYIDNINTPKIFAFIIMMMTQFCFNLFSNITVYYFSPAYVGFILLIGDLSFIFNFNEIEPLIFYGKIIFFVICLFMLLIYNELIEINFCGLSNYTRKGIMRRALEDYSLRDYRDNYREDIDYIDDEDYD